MYFWNVQMYSQTRNQKKKKKKMKSKSDFLQA